MNKQLAKSIFKLLLACITLAGGVIMFDLLLRRLLPDDRRLSTRPMTPPFQEVVEDPSPNLTKLYEILNAGSVNPFRFPIQVEQAMLVEGRTKSFDEVC